MSENQAKSSDVREEANEVGGEELLLDDLQDVAGGVNVADCVIPRWKKPSPFNPKPSPFDPKEILR